MPLMVFQPSTSRIGVHSFIATPSHSMLVVAAAAAAAAAVVVVVVVVTTVEQ
jgi:hypothetical protein